MQNHILKAKDTSKMFEKVCDYKILRVANCFGYSEIKIVIVGI